MFTTCAQFVGIGTGIALVRDSTRDPSKLRERFGQARNVYLFSGAFAFLIVWPLGSFMFSTSLSPLTLAALAGAELIAAPLLLPIAYQFQAEQRMNAFGLATTLMPIIRLGAIAILLLLDTVSISAFATTYFGLIVAVAAIVNLSQRPCKSPMPSLHSHVSFARSGLAYVVPNIMGVASTELDKTILLQKAGGELTGHYAAAFRVMQAATLPVTALMLAALPRQFRAKVDETRGAAKTLVLATCGYAIIAAALIWAVSPLLPRLLGDQFADSVLLLKGLMVVFVTECVRQIVTPLLTTADKQRARNLIEATATFSAVIAFVVFIPLFSVWGAISVLGAVNVFVIVSAVWSLRDRLAKRST